MVDVAGSPAAEGPSSSEPLRGCVELARFALTRFEDIVSEAERPVDWVWSGCAARSNVVMLCGPPGGGKTTLLFLLLAALASTRPVELLGRAVAPMSRGRVIVLVEGEQGQSSTARKLLASCHALGIRSEETLRDPETGVTRIVILARKSVLVGDERWKEIVRMVAAGVVGHVALDTLARVAPGDSNDEKEQTRIFDQVCQAIESAPTEESRPTVWVLTHSNKKDPSYTVNDVSGSAARAGQADSVALVYPNMEDGCIKSVSLYWPKVRDADDPLPAVTYTMAKRTLTVVDAPAKKSKRSNDELRPLVVAYVLSHQGSSGNEVVGGIGRRRVEVMDVIGSLIDERILVREGGKLYVPSEDGELPL